MKKTLLIIACFISSLSLAQLPANSLGADFTITDIDGQSHNLYDVLDEGKTGKKEREERKRREKKKKEDRRERKGFEKEKKEEGSRTKGA